MNLFRSPPIHPLAATWRKLLALLFLAHTLSVGAQNWQSALSQMPLGTSVRDLNSSNCVSLMLHSFQSNQTVKALVFMPGATDEFYMFRRARAKITNANPSLLDAVIALTNQTPIRARFYPPLLLLHTDEDPLEPVIKIEHAATAQKVAARRFPLHVLYFDRDWDFIQPILKKTLKVDVQPWKHTYDSWHFYRHSFAGWNLTGWEALQATTLAGKTTIAIQRRRLVFAGDERVRATPRVEPRPPGKLQF